MAYRSKLTGQAALSGLFVLALGACSSQPTTTETAANVDEEDPVAMEDIAEEPESDITTGQSSGDSDTTVQPAVSIVALEIDCPEAAVFFPTESAELDEDDKQILDELAQCLKGTVGAADIDITGAADPRGSEQFNEELARERAEAVADYLQEQGVEQATFEVYARGEQGMREDMPRLWPLQRHAVIETDS